MIEVGSTGSVELVVGEQDTAVAMGSGDVPVLATPRVVALVEGAAVRAVAEQLPSGQTSVGTEIALRHLAPTGIGGRVRATAQVVGVDGRMVRFDVSVDDGETVVAAGTHTRVVVDQARFLSRI